MRLGLPIYDTTPATPGIKAVRFSLRPWTVWALWDGRNWSKGVWTLAEAESRWRNHTLGARIRPEDQATRPVVRWQELISDEAGA